MDVSRGEPETDRQFRVRPLVQRLTHLYLNSDTRFPPVDDSPPGHTLRITPEGISGVGPWSS
jgi:hypothetical protein